MRLVMDGEDRLQLRCPESGGHVLPARFSSSSSSDRLVELEPAHGGSFAPNQVNLTEGVLSDIAENVVYSSYRRVFRVGGDEVGRNVRIRSDVTCAPAAASRCAPAAAAFVVLAAMFCEFEPRLFASVHGAGLCGVGEERVLDRGTSGHLWPSCVFEVA
jgi:hypothetical protein